MPVAPTYHFGPFCVDPAKRLLSRDGTVLGITPKAFDLLLCLIRYDGAVVSREQLLRDVWADCVVQEATLSQHVFLLRQALRQRDGLPLIATIPRRGYRFVPPVRDSDDTRDATRPADRPERTTAPIVGRTRELDELRQAASGTVKGRSQFVCVTGEAGAGKTSVVEAFIRHELCAASFVRVARSRCSERFGKGDTYLPIIDLLDDLRCSYGESVCRLLRAHAPSWHAQLEPQATNLQRPLDQLKRELCRFFEEITRDSPLCAFIDDWHWVGLSTLDVVSYISSHLASMRVLWVLACRSADLASVKSGFLSLKEHLQSRGLCHELSVGPLGPADVEIYLERELQPHAPPVGLGRLVYTLTEGNPLFMVDLLQHLRSRNWLIKGESGWTLTRGIIELQHQLPESTDAMVRRVLGQLTDANRNLLTLSSVQGYEFDSAIVAEAIGQNLSSTEDRLDGLSRAGQIIVKVEERDLPDSSVSTTYAFRHVLYQNSLFNSLGAARKAIWSRRVADALIAHDPITDRIAGRVAVLLDAARDSPRAIRYYALAAEHAARISAFPEAIALARRGLTLLRSTGAASGLMDSEVPLLLTLGGALGAHDGYAAVAVRRTYGRAYRLRGSMTRTSMVPTLFGLWAFYGLRGETRRQSRLSSQLLDMATAAGDDLFLARACAMHGGMLVHLGRLADGCALMERGLSLRCSDPTGGTFVLDSRVHAMSHLAEALALRGFLDQAVDRAREATQLSRQLASPYSLAFALTFLALVYRLRQDPTRACECAEETVEFGTEHQMPDPVAWASSIAAWARCCQGQTVEAVTAMTTVMEGQRSAARNPQYFHGTFAEILAAAGMLPEALEHVNHAINAARKSGDAYCLPQLWWVKGDIVARAQQAERTAEECFRTSTQLAVRQEATLVRLLAASSLCHLLNERGSDERRRSTAYRQLQDAYDSIPEGHDTDGVIVARRLLDESSRRVPA